ncbi:SDR family NAD(P)-dependent oxidoreductase [Paenibacillus sp. MMS18-CY102]|nr:SDR family NAD(P)-dependent oxidoreductase [Paenibacillus sp. MMS18-CY102]MWC28297.1 SDR family NAD(P)-dependent oxidoreductase [Paenibacillus sp. MMS18-CY102]
MASSRQEMYTQTIHHDNFIVRDHRVHGVRTLPGVALLDLIYRLASLHIGTVAVELHHVLFLKPIVTSEQFDQELNVQFEPERSGWKVTVSSCKLYKDGHKDGQLDVNMECMVQHAEKTEEVHERLDIEAFVADRNTIRFDMDDVYGIARSADIAHFPFMKTEGAVYQRAGEELMRLSLSELAEKYRDKFFAHPALLDGSTFAGSSFRLTGATDSPQDGQVPYIPFMLKRCCIYKPLPRTVYAYSKRDTDAAERTGQLPDIVSTAIHIFNEQGEKVADLIDMIAKRIREPKLIQNLIVNESKVEYAAAGGMQQPVREAREEVLPGTDADLGAGVEANIYAYLQQEIGRMLHLPADDIDISAGFYDIGLESSQLLVLVKQLEKKAGQQFYPTLLFEYSTIRSLGDYLAEQCGSAFGGGTLREQPLKRVHHVAPAPAPAASSKEELQPSGFAAGQGAAAPQNDELVIAGPGWIEQALRAGGRPNVKAQRVVVVSGKQDDPLALALLQAEEPLEIVHLRESAGSSAESLESSCIELLRLIQSRMLSEGPGPFLIQLVLSGSPADQVMKALAGLLKTAHMEHPHIHAQIITTDQLQGSGPMAALAELLHAEARAHEGGVSEIYYKGDSLLRHTAQLHEWPLSLSNDDNPYRNGGVYVITGGLGGLGAAVASHIARRSPKAKLALIGRSPLDPAKGPLLDSLRLLGATAVYVQADIGIEAEANRAVEMIKAQWGRVDGIIHCAGILKDSWISRKRPEELQQVLKPKVHGLQHLDRALRDEKLGFFVMFSSISAVTGNMAQSDYAVANAYMDLFAIERQEQVNRGARSGLSLSVNWPIWDASGMGIDPHLEQMMEQAAGLKKLPVPTGMKALDAMLAQGLNRAAVFYGNRGQIVERLGVRGAKPAQQPNHRKAERKQPEAASVSAASANRSDIAIIGVSGHYPMADTLDEFYDNLRQGKDCITDLPVERWKNNKLAYSADLLYQYGGFLDRIDAFDPLFFHISPRHAGMIDPQARLFLQTAWEACEDAGFSLERSEQHYRSSGGKTVGVFAGVFWSHYELLAAESTQRGEPMSFGNSPASIPNMVSYCLNLHGPSMAVDTMCSSSLTAIHLACDSIRKGESNYAIAGGVNLVTHPHKYMFLKQADFLSSEGKCRSFGENGDGYVPGEGVGAVMLTTLEEAEREGYPIYGVIKGSALNHVGKTSGAMVPDPVAQSEVIADAIMQAGIDPRTIGYIEAHGTGTSLGDPIEVQGLQRAFAKWTDDKQFCAIGSAKSNIGHLEAAAGIAGLTKLLLQFKHNQIFPSIHADQLNPHIPFERSPFYVERALRPWHASEIERSDGRERHPMRAGISSFGANGSNAHIILEAYAPSHQQASAVASGPVIVPLSAKSEQQLREYADKLQSYLCEHADANAGAGIRLADIAYTFQVGREPMNDRCAIIAATVEELVQKLQSFASGANQIERCYAGNSKQGKDAVRLFDNDKEAKQLMKQWAAGGKLGKLAELWSKGVDIDWSILYSGAKPRRVPLPAYPFLKEGYWVSSSEETGESLERSPLALSSFKRGISGGGEAPSLHAFEEIWKEGQHANEAEVMQRAGMAANEAGRESEAAYLCFLSDSHRQQEMKEAVRSMEPGSRMVFVAIGDDYVRHSAEAYTINPANLAHWQEAFQQIGAEQGAVAAAFYMWGLEDRAQLGNYGTVMNLLKAASLEKVKLDRLLLAASYSNGLERCYAESWIGFGDSLRLIAPNLKVAAIMDGAFSGGWGDSTTAWMKKLWSELHSEQLADVSYVDGLRHVRSYRWIEIPQNRMAFRPGGTYLITGGLGDLGLLFASHIGRHGNANLVLTGRSPLDAGKQSAIRALEGKGASVLYIQADVGDESQMRQGLQQAREQFGLIHGVIHAAGVEGAGNIFDNVENQFAAVTAPKISGTVALDKALEAEKLDFVCYFSSSSAMLGDFGSCDYAVANRFQTQFARLRNEWVGSGRRVGKTVVINWPLWEEGGMGTEQEAASMYLRTSGQLPLGTNEGIELFERLLGAEGEQYLIMKGERERLERLLGMNSGKSPQQAGIRPKQTSNSPSTAPRPSKAESKIALSGQQLQAAIRQDIQAQISLLMHTPVDRLDPEDNFADFGFDSVSLSGLASHLATRYQIELVPATLYGYATIDKLSQYLCSEYEEATRALFDGIVEEENDGAGRAQASETEASNMKSWQKSQVTDSSHSMNAVEEAVTRRSVQAVREVSHSSHSLNEPIAVIGMSGRFPGADSIEELWDNWQSGKNAISEVPADRWDWKQYDGDPHREPFKTNSRWGGFIRDIARFDSLFFEISPSEAEQMDPQQRLFVEEAWHAFEDAGYMGERIRGSLCGVYVGVEESQYGFITGGEGQATGNQNALLPARIAYLLDLKGPNMALTAACSSGLAAIHQACQALRQGDCDMALAGGVSLLVSPVTHIALGQAGMLSSDGECSVFDERANGLVPGEAAAALVLKPLSKAIADGDRIYGCIKASGVNYDGKTNGITSPDPISQAELVRRTYDKFEIDPRQISFMLAHSVGSRIGDSIEVQALNQAFGSQGVTEPSCVMGSLKPLIGHTFAASGVVSVIAMLMAMKHRTMPGMTKLGTLNSQISTKSKFAFSKGNLLWDRMDETPRLGAVSTTGISGSNAHAVIEEYVPPVAVADEKRTGAGRSPSMPHVFVLSAKSEERLRAYARQVGEHMRRVDDSELANAAITLQLGREAMEYRLAVIARTAEELAAKLQQFGERGQAEGIRFAHVGYKQSGNNGGASFETAGADLDHLPSSMQPILNRWLSGSKVAAADWKSLYAGQGAQLPAMIPMPLYPFAGDRCWAEAKRPPASRNESRLHPLLHRNASDFEGQKFQSGFMGDEFFFADHIVQGKRVLPGVAHLEMARAALELSLPAGIGKGRAVLRNVVWARPVAADEHGVQVAVQLFQEDERSVSFEIIGGEADGTKQPDLHSQGTVEIIDPLPEQFVDLHQLRSQCVHELDLAHYYETYRSLGIAYGERHRGIAALYSGADGQGRPHVLARLELPASIKDTLQAYALHPCLLDSALHASAALASAALGDGGQETAGAIKLALPFAVDEVDLRHSCGDQMWAYVRLSEGSSLQDAVQKMDVDICDETGRICVQIRKFSARTVQSAENRAETVAYLQTQPSPAMDAESFSVKLLAFLKQELVAMLKVSSDEIDGDAQWDEYGVDAVKLDELSNQLNTAFGLDTNVAELMECTSLRSLVRHLAQSSGQGASPQVQETPSYLETAGGQQAGGSDEENGMKQQAVVYLTELLSTVIKLPPNRIDPDAPLEKYGIDSLMVIRLTTRLEDVFGSLPKTIFFEHQTIRSVSGYFMSHHRSRLAELLGPRKGAAAALAAGRILAEQAEPAPAASDRTALRPLRKRKTLGSAAQAGQEQSGGLDIAIIGVAGRYPGARSVSEFWENLREGRDSITEIPKERWDHSLYFDPDKDKPGKTYSKWGGFIDDVDKFDPLFFNISPREAEMMDPQERLFLQCVHETLEDAGYTRAALAKTEGPGKGGSVGVYVGVMYEEYQMHGVEETLRGRPVALTGNPSSIANRVSYYFNFNGPSMAIDTACSSSLTAIYLACQSLVAGGCEIAVAGGVNASLHPNKYLMLGQGKFVSSKGRCESFGVGGDGYVPGEGVGAVLLKPLAKAVADGDQIYGVIKAAAINHGGKTNGYTVPNPNAQAKVIAQAVRESGIDPRTISYIEAHGTGTSLGDPIEIAGLTKAFSEFTADKQFCSIGSVKSNIGHCESAAGIAGVTKILMQMKHRELAPSLHSGTLNPNIAFEATPFSVQQERGHWSRPVVQQNGVEQEHPRRAGISGFGAGGSNAHLIIEEYRPGKELREQNGPLAESPRLFVFSARSEERLQAVIAQMATYVESTPDARLADVAYTLQTGREEMAYRAAILAHTREELLEALRHYAGHSQYQECAYADTEAIAYFGNLEDERREFTGLLRGNTGDAMLRILLKERDYNNIALYWTLGGEVPWEQLYEGEAVRRISLPAYPFESIRCWFPWSDDSSPIQADSGIVVPSRAPMAALSGSSAQAHVPSQVQAEGVRLAGQGISPDQAMRLGNRPEDPLDAIQAFIAELLSNELKMAPTQFKPHRSMYDYGVDSLVTMKLIRACEQQYEVRLTGRDFVEHDTIQQLAQRILELARSAGAMIGSIRAPEPVEPTIEPMKQHRTVDTAGLPSDEALELFRSGGMSIGELEQLLDTKPSAGPLYTAEGNVGLLIKQETAVANDQSASFEADALELFRDGLLTLDEIDRLIGEGEFE